MLLKVFISSHKNITLFGCRKWVTFKHYNLLPHKSIEDDLFIV